MLNRPGFELLVVTSKDGFIGRLNGPAPHFWASPEEQVHFLDAVGRADWSFMGRRTHEDAPKADRRRVIFTEKATKPEWRGPHHLFVNPAKTSMDEIIQVLNERFPVQSCLILGGTRVHDWFLQKRMIDRVILTIEPLSFGEGMPLFSHHPTGDPRAILESEGFGLTKIQTINQKGTVIEVYEPEPARMDTSLATTSP